MKKNSKNKKGFTLVEMLLSIAIIVMIGGVIAGLCASISHSYATTYNINDAADYAVLFARGFENSFLSFTQGDGKDKETWKWYITRPGVDSEANVPTLMVKDSEKKEPIPVFHPRYLTGATTDTTKWSVYIFFKVEETPNKDPDIVENSTIVLYRIFIIDSANKNFGYRYDGKVWVPRFDERASMQGVDGRTIKVLKNSKDAQSFPMTTNTFENVYNLKGTKAYDMIKDSLETDDSTAEYYSRIQYWYSGYEP